MALPSAPIARLWLACACARAHVRRLETVDCEKQRARAAKYAGASFYALMKVVWQEMSVLLFAHVRTCIINLTSIQV